MTKKTVYIFVGALLAIAIMSASVIIYFRHHNNAITAQPVANGFSIPDGTEGKSTNYYVEPIKKPESKAIIEEPAASKPEDTVPPPEVAETTEPDGTTVQTPNWEAQKELAPDADISNPDSQPEYVKSNPVKPTVPAASAPKNGDTKTVDGQRYVYDKAFGWIKDGGANVGTVVDAPTTGNKVGY